MPIVESFEIPGVNFTNIKQGAEATSRFLESTSPLDPRSERERLRAGAAFLNFLAIWELTGRPIPKRYLTGSPRIVRDEIRAAGASIDVLDPGIPGKRASEIEAVVYVPRATRLSIAPKSEPDIRISTRPTNSGFNGQLETALTVAGTEDMVLSAIGPIFRIDAKTITTLNGHGDPKSDEVAARVKRALAAVA